MNVCTADDHDMAWSTLYTYYKHFDHHRSTECNITINSRAVSRFSAVFEYNQDTNSTWITSLGSNLITVDKKDLANDQPMELQPGSLIEVCLV